MRSRVALGTLFGTIGGIVGYLLQEATVPHAASEAAARTADLLLFGFLVGAVLGLAIGAIEGAAVGSPARLLRGAALGAAIGAVGGMVGVYFGGAAFNAALAGRSRIYLENSTSPLDFVHLVTARALGWTFLGAFPGLAAGAAARSARRALHGLVGGLAGGFIGGLLFDPLAQVVAPVLAPAAAVEGAVTYEAGSASRAIGLTVIGGLTGLAIGLVEEALKQAWVRVLAGRNEGRDFIISKPLTVLGRDERADVPLYGDPGLAAQHAAIRLERGRHTLLDGGAPPTPIVNGQPMTQPLLLRDGDMVQLGQVRLLFREKATATRVQAPADPSRPDRGGAGPPVPATHCPFCGAPRDAAGQCLCTVAGAAPPTGPGSVPPAYDPARTQAWGPGATGAGKGTQLVCMEGPCAGRVFALTGPSVTVGRDPGSAVALVADRTVSRSHARIVEEGGRHVLYDEGSSNGTYVNATRVQVHALSPGDVLALGATRLRYE